MYLQHFNPFHDKLGRFASSRAGQAAGRAKDTAKTAYGAAKTNKLVLRESSNASGTASSMLRRSADRSRKKMGKEMDLSNMTDDELRKRINRLNMEKQYRSLTTEDVMTGRDYAADILEATRDVLAIGASAVAIGTAMQAYRRNQGLLHGGIDYLEHHGILGQKWGKKNGPPYPLDASDHSDSEKKALRG
jgi:hypothetical protein